MTNNVPLRAQVNVDLRQLETLKCPECNHPIFVQTDVYKVLPAIQSPSGRAQIIRLLLATCEICASTYYISDSGLIPIEDFLDEKVTGYET